MGSKLCLVWRKAGEYVYAVSAALDLDVVRVELGWHCGSISGEYLLFAWSDVQQASRYFLERS